MKHMEKRADMFRSRLDEDSFASTVYDPDTYDDLPTYQWDETLNLDRFAQAIDDSNNRLFGRLKVAICHKLSIGFRSAGCESQVA